MRNLQCDTSANPSFSCDWHVPLCGTNWLPVLKVWNKNLVRFPKVKMSWDFEKKIKGSNQYQTKLSILLACSASLHKMAARAKYRKKALSFFYRSNCWWDFEKNTSQKWSVPTLVMHFAGMFRLTAKIETLLYGFHKSNCWQVFNQTSQNWSIPTIVV